MTSEPCALITKSEFELLCSLVPRGLFAEAQGLMDSLSKALATQEPVTVKLAQQGYQRVVVDDNAIVHREPHEKGAWVMGWLFVPDPDLPVEVNDGW